MSLKKKEIEHIAQLARIELTDREKVKFTEQLTEILAWIDQLNEVSTEEIGFGLPGDLTNVLREDEILPFSNVNFLTDAWPDAQDGHLKVKGVK